MANERQEETSATAKLTYLLIGGGIGAIVALLFAPKSGHELRGDIADVTRKGLEKGKETATQIGERAGEYYEVTRDRAGELYSAAQEKAGELTERAKGAVTQTANPFSAALEAGKQAYNEEKRRTDTSTVAERPTYPVENKSLGAGTAATTTTADDETGTGTGTGTGAV